MPHESKPDRRMLLLGLALTGAASAETRSKKKGDEEKDVAADELLMREHGVMRRTMLVYAAVAEKLRTGANVDADVLNRTARLFRNFAEDYHEKRLEEAYIFPAARNAGGDAGRFADVLQEQHQRGRELTGWIGSVTMHGSIAGKNAADLAKVLDGMALMFAHHMAREDTLVFPAWKQGLAEREYRETSEKFLDMERLTLGHDGFADAVKQIASIEEAFGIADIEPFTPPPPPVAATA